MDVRLEKENAAVKPTDPIVRFKGELKGCVKISKISSVEVKKIWNA